MSNSKTKRRGYHGSGASGSGGGGGRFSHASASGPPPSSSRTDGAPSPIPPQSMATLSAEEAWRAPPPDEHANSVPDEEAWLQQEPADDSDGNAHDNALDEGVPSLWAQLYRELVHVTASSMDLKELAESLPPFDPSDSAAQQACEGLLALANGDYGNIDNVDEHKSRAMVLIAHLVASKGHVKSVLFPVQKWYDAERLPGVDVLQFLGRLVHTLAAAGYPPTERMRVVLSRRVFQGVVARLVDEAQPLAGDELDALMGLGDELPLANDQIQKMTVLLEEFVLDGTRPVLARIACLYVIESAAAALAPP